ncbi:MAG: T9SS type A sorting domain-containing protein, partial [Chitinophagaceae bacterium]|nr:T9SS type A sorting domain-containing protein [Chitinophagaceae bacterium]
ANGGTDIFVSKFDTAGNFLWANGLGGPGTDGARGVVCDNNDNVFVTGNFGDTVDFDLTVDEAILRSKGKSDIFLLKLNAGGNCKWVKQMGGAQSDSATAIALDANKNIIITGNFGDTADFDPDVSEALLYSKGVGDVYIAKYDPDGNYIWANSMQGAKNDMANAIITDNASNIYTTGSFRDTLTVNAAGSKLFAKAFYDDAYIAKHDSMGNLVWAKQFTCTGSVINKSIDLDNDDNVFLTGYYTGKTDFDPSADSFDLIANSYYYDLFVSKLNNTGGFEWAFGYGGAYADLGNSISVNNANSIFVTGAFNGTVDFDPTAGTSWLNSNGHDDVFIMKLENYSLGITSPLTSGGSFHISPNPSSGIFNIKFPTNELHQVAVYDLLGNEVLMHHSAKNMLNFDLSNQASGMYFVKVWSKGQLIGTSKLLKQ